LANNQGLSIRQLALELERDYKNVYDDVQRLMSLGLIEVQNATLHVPYDEIDIRKTLGASIQGPRGASHSDCLKKCAI